MTHAALTSAHDAIRHLRARFPWISWVERWGISTASVLSGFATLFIFRRGLEYFPWFVGYLLLSYLAAVVFAGAREGLERRGAPLLTRVVDYTVQTLLHGLFLFLLPIYYASTTLVSPNLWLLVVLLFGAVLTAVDPWYRALLGRARWVELWLFGVGLFASLNVAFPLIGVRSAWGLLLSGAGSMLSLAPLFRRQGRRWGEAVTVATVSAAVLCTGLWWARDWIPPVPLHLFRATFSRGMSGLEPVDGVERVEAQVVRGWGRLTAFAAIVAPAGLQEHMVHVWLRDGRPIARIPVAVVTGGRPGGFRTYSWKRDLGTDPTGIWQVEVRTAHDQLVGRIQVIVVPE